MSSALTLQDLVSHVMDAADLSENIVDIRRAVRSSLWGYEQATTRHQWGTYDTQFTAYFNDAYTTGTVDIDASGVVTLTGGTFPSWADLASIYLGDESAYRVLTRDGDTQVTLENWNGQTKSASTYTLRQDRVLISDEVREVYDVWNETENWALQIVDAKEFRNFDKPRVYSGSTPYLVCFRSVRIDGVNKTEMRISPAVSTATELDVAYIRRPRQPRTLVCKVGTAASETVTITSPIPLGASIVGSLVRHAGEIPPTADVQFGIQNPTSATFEGVVSAQASTTQFTVPGIPNFTSETIVITDVLDIPQYLMVPVQLYAEAHMRRIARGDFQGYAFLMNEADESLRYAMEQDAPYSRRSNKPIVRIDRLEPMKDLYIVEA